MTVILEISGVKNIQIVPCKSQTAFMSEMPIFTGKLSSFDV